MGRASVFNAASADEYDCACVREARLHSIRTNGGWKQEEIQTMMRVAMREAERGTGEAVAASKPIPAVG